MTSKSGFIRMAVVTLTGLASASPYLTPRAACDSSTLNTTTGTYTVLTGDTIFTIATATDRGVCDIARANRMADATIITSGEELIIPAQVCDSDSTTCLLTDTRPTNNCVLGGPHTYLTLPNDTIASIATTKFNITIDSLFSNRTATMLGISDANNVIPAGNTIKLPLCYPSQCIIQPYTFTYGTYKDLADLFGIVPGQIFAFNPGYNHSDAAVGEGPVIAVPTNCVALSMNVSVIS